MNRKIRYILSALIIGAVSMILCGAGPLDRVALNPQKIYKNYSLNEILKDISNNGDKAKNNYHDKYAAVNGTVENTDSLNLTITIKGEGKDTLEVTTVMNADELKKGDKVKIYGRLYSHILGISMQADKVVKTADKSEPGTYETLSGKKYLPAMSASRSLGKGHMNYDMPSEWAEVEKKLDNVDGYQYKLNEISSSYKLEAEQLYVFYFSNEKYLLSMSDKSDTTGIEKAIINNLLPKEKIPTLTFNEVVRTGNAPTCKANGNTYDYYLTSFEDSSRKVHNVEFVFVPNGDDGMACILYIYSESNHKNDIMYMMSTIKTER